MRNADAGVAVRHNRPVAAFAIVLCLLFGAGAERAEAALFNTQAALDAAPGLAMDPMFDSVGGIVVYNAGVPGLAGGGVLIHDEWIITAGHVAQNGGLLLWDSYEFTLSNDLFSSFAGVAADQVYVYPGYNEATCSPGQCVDLALMHLATPITSVMEAIIGTSVVGDHFYAAGYGAPGVGFNEGSFDDILRAGENSIDCIGCLAAVNNNYFLSDYDTAAFEFPLAMEWRASQFDSAAVGSMMRESSSLSPTSFAAKLRQAESSSTSSAPGSTRRRATTSSPFRSPERACSWVSA